MTRRASVRVFLLGGSAALTAGVLGCARGGPPRGRPDQRWSATSTSMPSRGGSAAGRPTTGYGPGATRSSSASARVCHGQRPRPARHRPRAGRKSTCSPAAATAARPGRSRTRPPAAPWSRPARPSTESPRRASRRRPWRDCPGGIDFTHPDFALTVRMTDTSAGPSRFYYSTDRGRTWDGPFRLPLFGQKGVAARTDYLVNGQERMPAVPDRVEGGRARGPAVLRAGRPTGAKTWEFVAWIGDEPAGYAIMPSTVRLGPDRLLTVIRCREGESSWIDTYRSGDGGKTWALGKPPAVPDTGEGNPASLIRLRDGRVCLTYGYRAEPFGIRARLSQDDGRTWDPEVTLRSDGGGRGRRLPAERAAAGRDGGHRVLLSRHAGRGPVRRGHDLGPGPGRTMNPVGPIIGQLSSSPPRRPLLEGTRPIPQGAVDPLGWIRPTPSVR